MKYKGYKEVKKIGRVTIYNDDCMNILKQTPDNYYSLALVDPPYGIGESGGRNHTRGLLATAKNYKPFSGGDNEPPNKSYFNELNRVSKNQIIWGANHFIRNIQELGKYSWVVWDKDNIGTDFADCELAISSYKKAVRKFKYRWNGMLQQNMKNKELRIHPTQKPVALYEWLLTNYAKQGDSILDTHMGSGSIAIATNKLGFDLTACELDKDYYRDACKRIENESKQVDMFTPSSPEIIQGSLL